MVALRRKKKDNEEKLSFCSRFSDNRNRRLVLATNEWEPFFFYEELPLWSWRLTASLQLRLPVTTIVMLGRSSLTGLSHKLL